LKFSRNQARCLVSGAAHMVCFVFFVFLPALVSASKTVQEKGSAAFSQGEFDGTVLYNENVRCSNTWSALNGNIGPLADCRAALGGEKIILFGGKSSTSPVIRRNETYAFNAASGSWDEIAVTTAPSSRTSFGMDGDGDGKIVLFGGYDGSNTFKDTWLFAENDWSLVECSTHPSSRMGAAMARLSTNTILLFGGKKGAVSYSDTDF